MKINYKQHNVMNNKTQTTLESNTQSVKGGFKYYMKKIGNFLLDVLCIF